jgi:nucleoside 2-deoxyribosyltransferase
MWFHAIAHYGTRKRYWWNRHRDDLVQDIIVPFVGKQVKPLTRAGVSSLFNFGSASYVTIVKTRTKLKRPGKGKIPSELSDAKFVKENSATDEFLHELTSLSSATSTRSLIERALTPPKEQVFVIMKFGDERLDSAYEGVIKPVAREFDLDVIRVDEIQDSGQISQQILENIACSRVVIAELTGERPNCYYEAGFAHALGKELVFVINEESDIHFDLSGYRFITWRTESQLRNRLRERLESITEKGAG